MKALFVESRAIAFEAYVEALRAANLQAEIAPDTQAALWLLAGGSYRAVVLDLREEDLHWEVIAAALWSRPPARVIALVDSPVDPALRRQAYGAGVWELAALPAHRTSGFIPSLVPAVRRAIGETSAPAVLFLDSCSEITAGIGALLAEEGYCVEPASTTAGALQMMSSRGYALIITEIRRVGPDGFQVIREAACLQPGVPVIVLAATMDDATFMKSVELGASACVWKLAEPEEIMRQINASTRLGHVGGSRKP